MVIVSFTDRFKTQAFSQEQNTPAFSEENADSHHLIEVFRGIFVGCFHDKLFVRDADHLRILIWIVECCKKMPDTVDPRSLFVG